MKMRPIHRERLHAHADCLETILDGGSRSAGEITRILQHTMSSFATVYPEITEDDVVLLTIPCVKTNVIYCSLNDNVDAIVAAYRQEVIWKGNYDLRFSSGNPELVRDSISYLRNPGKDSFSSFMKKYVIDDENYNTKNIAYIVAEALIASYPHKYASAQERDEDHFA